MSVIRRREPTKFRQAFAAWVEGQGKQYEEHTPGKPNYVKLPEDLTTESQPSSNEYHVFPRNKKFRSQPVLSEELKEAVWQAVTKKGHSVRQASVSYKIDMRRIGAVIRLKEIEKQWKAEGKPLASAYSKAVMEMLPQTALSLPPREHEPINDLTVLPSTKPQIFWPVAESQHFTRVEAGKAFDTSLLPAEKRIPHTHLYKIAKRVAQGAAKEEVTPEEWKKANEKDTSDYKEIQDKVKKREARTTIVQTPRWAYKFEAVTVDKGGIGKFVDGIGQRYGVPHQDRKKGQVKIPTKVDG